MTIFTKHRKLALLILVGALLFATPAVAQTGLRPYYFTVVDEFGSTVTDDANMRVYIAGSSAATVYSDKKGTAIGSTLESVTDGIFKFWYGPASCDIVVKNNSTGNAVKYAGLSCTDHRIMLSRVEAQLGATTYTGSVVGVAATWSGTFTANASSVLGGDATDDLTINAEIQNYTGNNWALLEGATDNDFETTLAVADPTADNVLTLPDDTGSVGYTPTGKTTSAADVLAIVVTHAVVEKTTGADAEALTLADGENGQILVIVLKVDGGGIGTLTPSRKTGFTTIVFADAGDTASVMYVDDTVGWIILGTAGVAAPPLITQ